MVMEIAIWKGLTLNAAEQDQGRFEARSAKFGVLNYNDQVWLPGCCDKTTRERPRVPVTWQHDLDIILGYAELNVEGEFLVNRGEVNRNIAVGRDAWELMKQGVMAEWSPGFYVIQERQMNVGNHSARGLVEVKVAEIALLPIGFAANPDAQTRMLNRIRNLSPDAFSDAKPSGPDNHPLISGPVYHPELKAALSGILAGIKTLTSNIREVNKNVRR